jgi:hypothetical protein
MVHVTALAADGRTRAVIQIPRRRQDNPEGLRFMAYVTMLTDSDSEIFSFIKSLRDELRRRGDPDLDTSPRARTTIQERPAARGCYRLELVKCGKSNCHCAAGETGHGPYWYWYGRRANGRMASRYIGKELRELASELLPI